ncbi:MAG: hypothetical protein R3F19_10685 [Verrucomicrobiales bacterium]
MLRHVAEPFDTGRLHGGVGVEAFGDGVGDDGLPFSFSSSISRRSATSPSVFAVSRSRKAAMAVCSAVRAPEC